MRVDEGRSRGVLRCLMIILTLGPVAVGCAKKEVPPPPAAPAPIPAPQKKTQVTTVELGNTLGDNKRVKSPATSFSRKDTIFASVVTEGGAAGELTARWTFQDGQVVNETKRTIAASERAVTEFSIQKPGGWPAGAYRVEISLDGRPAETKAFQVQ